MTTAVDLRAPAIPPLLGRREQSDPDHVRSVASVKRFLERWVMDDTFRSWFEADEDAALASLHLPLTVSDVTPFIDSALARELRAAEADGTDGRYPLAVRRYRAFIREKQAHRPLIREGAAPAHPALARWRQRQIKRCIGQLGPVKADGLVHAPFAVELTKGCSVGCWFCGVSADKLAATFAYADAGDLWRGVLATLRAVIGPAAEHGFLYWATDPLDNADYERFVSDFHAVLGRCPQTTTAIPARDMARTRRLLALAAQLGSSVDRFTITRLATLDQVHAEFAPEDILHVELIPQNRQATTQYRKANAGRARRVAARRADLAVDNSTIACVSGFLLNMVDRSVRLITPCPADERWPDGYWVLGRRTFEDAASLRTALESLVDELVVARLPLSKPMTLRRDIKCEAIGDEIHLVSRWVKVRFHGFPQPIPLAKLLDEGRSAAEEIALRLEDDHDVPVAVTLAYLDEIFDKGLVHEEPEPDRAVAEQR